MTFSLKKDLRDYNTFRISVNTDRWFSFQSENELIAFIKGGEREDNTLILGGGSNILFTGDFHGIVIHPENKGIKTVESNSELITIKVEAGEVWDNVVSWAAGKGYGGLENLSMIPGLTGAVPVQNIGAYGCEAAETIHRVRAVSLDDGKPIELTAEECRFGYRDSLFKHELKDKVVITSVWFRLNRNPIPDLSYEGLVAECGKTGGTTPAHIRQAIINIRTRKLPDPEARGNAGSFFMNPVVSPGQLSGLLVQYPDMPHYIMPDGMFKVAAAWLVEQSGWKGKRLGDAGVHDHQALVIVNYGNATGREISELAGEITRTVKENFGILLKPEVEIV